MYVVSVDGIFIEIVMNVKNDGKTNMRVKIIVDEFWLPYGSVIQDVRSGNNTYYRGMWSSMEGSYTVDVPKEFCEVISEQSLSQCN